MNSRAVERNREAELRDLLHRQQASPEAAAFLEYLVIRLDKANRKMMSAESPEVYRLQGICLELHGIINGIRRGSLYNGES